MVCISHGRMSGRISAIRLWVWLKGCTPLRIDSVACSIRRPYRNRWGTRLDLEARTRRYNIRSTISRIAATTALITFAFGCTRSASTMSE